VIVVATADPTRNVEVETARYYLPAGCGVIAARDATAERLARLENPTVYFASGARQGQPVHPVPEAIGAYRFSEVEHFPGLNVYRGAR
jgi:hypothetical protein